MNAVFLPRRDIYKGDFWGLTRDPSFEFSAGMHFHDFYEVQLYFTEGTDLSIRDHHYALQPGDIVLIRMFEPHKLSFKKNVTHKRFSICLDASFLLSACSQTSNLIALFENVNPRYPVIHFDPEHFRIYEKLCQKYEDPPYKAGIDVFHRAVLYELLACLLNDLQHDINVSASSSITNTVGIISHLLNYINTHLQDNLSLEILSRETHFSPPYLCRVFKQYTGNTLKQYINLKKIDRAQQLLLSGVPANIVCSQIGFTNYSWFYKLFHAIAGTGPQEYQKIAEQNSKLHNENEYCK